MLGLASETGSILNVYKKYLRDGIDLAANREYLREELGDLLWYVAAVATACGLDLEGVAEENLRRTRDRYPRQRAEHRLGDLLVFDADYPEHERFPRRLTVAFAERPLPSGRAAAVLTLVSAEPNAFPYGPITLANGKLAGFQIGAELGDPLTDNSRRVDVYRFHDAIHMGFMAVLGWSPTLRALLRLKRKSDPETDECEDGARAIFAEEGLAAVLSRLAKRRTGFLSQTSVDGEVIEVAKAAAVDLEVEPLPAWLWRSAICQGFRAMHQLGENAGGYLIADLDARTLTYKKVPYVSAPAHADFRDAVCQLHREKDAAYRDAWKKRGEVLSILANIARKVDRLDYVLDGAQTTRDESLLDTTVDLFVYTLKYQTYLADLDSEVAGKLFCQSGISGPYSDGPNGFEHLLLQVDLSALDAEQVTVTEAASRVITRFSELEACFTGINTSHPVATRQEAAEALTDVAVCLIGALSREVHALYGDFLASHREGHYG
jgi:NTP pyrophosphatase (non-canonical NTP hydrolase)